MAHDGSGGPVIHEPCPPNDPGLVLVLSPSWKIQTHRKFKPTKKKQIDFQIGLSRVSCLGRLKPGSKSWGSALNRYLQTLEVILATPCISSLQAEGKGGQSQTLWLAWPWNAWQYTSHDGDLNHQNFTYYIISPKLKAMANMEPVFAAVQ